MSIRPRKRTQTVISQAKAYDTILRPVVTEKATMGNEHGQVPSLLRWMQPSLKLRRL